MSISPLYIPLFTIEEVILDKDSGLPLSGGVVKFYRDLQRATPKPVYQISGNPPDYTFDSVGNELTLGIAGDFVDTNGDPFVPYAYPYDAAGDIDLYYVTVESEGGVAQFTREAVPYTGDGTIPPAQRASTENELSNPQFVEVFFPAPGSTIINVTGANTVTKIAPDWDLITSGTGAVTVERLEPTSANVPTNPPYALRISTDSALGASIQLRQRLTNTPSIFRGDFLSATLTAAVISGGGSALSLAYVPSTGTSTTIIPSTNVTTDGAYHTIVGNAPLPQQANDAASVGYIDIIITLPTSRNIAITSIQVVGTADSTDIPFDQQTSARQKDHLFHYYENSILRQPKDNLLTGWNFGLNPWQFRSTASSNVANNTYTADQTIIVQQAYVDSATANNVAVSRAAVADNYAFTVTAVTATNKFAMVQYIDPNTIRPYWGKKLSALVNMLVASPTHSTLPRIKMRLIYRASLPPTIAQDDPISAWTNTAGSDPSFKAGWTAVAPLNDPIYTLSGAYQEFSFDQMLLPASSNANMTIGLVIYTLDNMNQAATADSILVQDVSLVNNDFAIKASSLTFDETLRRCQYYYEKSYDAGTLPGTAGATSQAGALQGIQNVGGTWQMYATNLSIIYNTVKNKAPVVQVYSPSSGAAGNVDAYITWHGGTATASAVVFGTYWTQTSTGTKSTQYDQGLDSYILSQGAGGNSNAYGHVLFHYIADSRLGA